MNKVVEQIGVVYSKISFKYQLKARYANISSSSKPDTSRGAWHSETLLKDTESIWKQWKMQAMQTYANGFNTIIWGVELELKQTVAFSVSSLILVIPELEHTRNHDFKNN